MLSVGVLVTETGFVSIFMCGNTNGFWYLPPLFVETLEEAQLEQIDWDRTCDFSTMITELCAGAKMNPPSNAMMLKPITTFDALRF